MFPNLILNGIQQGGTLTRLIHSGMDPRVLRQFLHTDGRSYLDVRQPDGSYKAMVCNAPATLTRDAWIQFDETALETERNRRVLWDDLTRINTYTIPDGWGKSVLQYNTATHSGEAIMSMSPLRRAERDRPEFDTAQMPLPLQHDDWSFEARELAIGANMRVPLDTIRIQHATINVLEFVEKLVLGLGPLFSYAGNTIYGYLNWPSAMTKVITDPGTGGWTGNTLVQEFLAARQQLYDAKMFGPYYIYAAPYWDQVLDEDYSLAKGDLTLRQRLENLAGVGSGTIKTIEWMTGKKIVWVRRDSRTARAVVGMDLTNVQWTTNEFELNGKTMCIRIPQLRTDPSGAAGVLIMDVA